MTHAHTLRHAHLADVMFSGLQSLSDLPNPLEIKPSHSIIVMLVDGLGLENLMSSAGYAPLLAQHNVASLDAGFPSSTVNGITTLTTGATSGRTGMTGYVAKNPATGGPLNLLKGLASGAHTDPRAWQAQPTWFERTTSIDTFVVGPKRFSDSGLTHAALRGAAYVAAERIEDTIATCVTLATASDQRLIYGYVPTLDQLGHKAGTTCDAWLAALETLNSSVQQALPELTRVNAQLLLTADHGMVNVNHEIDVNWILDDPAVDFVGGEPRCLQVFLASGSDSVAVQRDIVDHLEESAVVLTKAEAIADGWFGTELRDGIAERIGDVLMTPTAPDCAFAIARLGTSSTTHMVGQHGGRTSTERYVPLVVLP